MIPVTFTTLVSRMVPREKYTTAMGIYNSSGDLGFFIGPLLGGIAALLGIRAAFLLSLPLGAATVLIGLTGIAAAGRSQEPL
jgi:MFS family permease